MPGSFYAPQSFRWIPRDGEPEWSPQPEIPGHEGLAYEAAHFARLVAEGRRESDLLPLAETVAVVQTMEAALADAFE